MLVIRQRLISGPRKQGSSPANGVNIQTHTPSVHGGCLSRQFIAMLLLQLLPVTALLADDNHRFRGDSDENWAATWSTTLHQPDLGVPGLANAGFHNQTLRQIVHASMGGRKVRVRFSTFGASGLVVGAAHIALAGQGSAVIPGSDRVLSFGGKPSITIPAGAPVVSDPVELAVPDLGNLAITIYLPQDTGPATWHFDARQISYISGRGDFTGSTVMQLDAATPTTQSWFWLAGVDVMTPEQSGAIVALGDSTTDGDRSTVGANHRWPDQLAKRLLAERNHFRLGVVNEGLDGNGLLHDFLGPNGLARFERDVLSQPEVSHVIVFFGNNDIFATDPDQEVTFDQIVQGYEQLIKRAHARGVDIFFATLTPLEGFIPPGANTSSYSPDRELKRQQVNDWIRMSGEFDGVIDFDRVLRDPDEPARLAPKYDSGDHGHPTDEGYKAMAEAIDLSLFSNGDRR
jgi:lysophospholipase L1-like esterase